MSGVWQRLCHTLGEGDPEFRGLRGQRVQRHHDDIIYGSCWRVANNLNISILGLDGQMAVVALDAAGIVASTRSACSTGEEEPSHVLLALGRSPTGETLGMSVEQALQSFRLTLLPGANYSDARRIVAALGDIAQRYRTTVE